MPLPQSFSTVQRSVIRTEEGKQRTETGKEKEVTAAESDLWSWITFLLGHLFIIYHLCQMLPPDWSNHPPLSQRKRLRAAALCSRVGIIMFFWALAHTKLGHISIQTSLCISDTPRTQLSASLYRTQTPSRTTEPLCSPWMISPLCTAASSFGCLSCARSAPSPPLLMRINGWWSCASVWTCVRWLLNTVLTRLVSLTSQTMLQELRSKAQHYAQP